MPESEILIEISGMLRRFMRGRVPAGIDRVGLAYVRHFADRARAVVRYRGRALVFSKDDSLKLFKRPPNPSPAYNWLVRGLVARQMISFRDDRDLAGAFYFNTGLSALDYPSSVELVRRLGLRVVFLVHDLIPITHPEFCGPGERENHVARMSDLFRLAGGVITNSNATLAELESYAATTGHTMPPSVAAPLAPVERTPAATERPMAEPYFVVLGTIEPRKNHWLLLQLWRRLVGRHGVRAPRLVVIGERGWECENAVDMLERCAALRGFVVELSACSDKDVATWLHHSRALLFPSFAEGYGMPLVEALSLGVPVIASDLPVFREIAGEIPEYLDPMDGIGWLARIESYSQIDSPERNAQLGRLLRFVPSTWPQHFRVVDDFLDRLRLELPPSPPCQSARS
jgi:glycosyltransferase involved in cell wall biosynthesis